MAEPVPPQVNGRVTYRDIAERVNTSVATVSLVLTGRESRVGISAATRQAVLDAARSLSYTPVLSARRLRHHQSAAASPEITLAIVRSVGTPIRETARGIEAVAQGLAEHAPSSQLVIEEYQPSQLSEQPGLRIATRFHGAIVTSLTPADEAFLERSDLPVPVVAFQRRLTRHAYVDVDNVAGGLAVTRHLLARGRRRLAAVGWATASPGAMHRRLEGFRRALGEAGLAETAHVELAPELSEAGGAAGGAAALQKARPDGILALSDVLAVGVLHAIRRAGLRVPEDIAVVGYDEQPFAPYLAPPLTTVRLPYEAMALAAVDWLVQAIRGRADERLATVLDPELIVRESA